MRPARAERWAHELKFDGYRMHAQIELCAVRPDGTTSFSLMQAATEGEDDRLVYFVFDLLHQDGEDLLLKPLLERKARLAE